MPRRRLRNRKNLQSTEKMKRHKTEKGRVARITIDFVPQARAEMLENKVHGPEDSIVSETIKQLPQEKIYEITRCSQDRFVALNDAPSSWKIAKLVFLRKPRAAPKKGVGSYRAISLTSTCVILTLEREKEAEGWIQRHVGGIDGIICQHLQVMMT